MRKVFITGANKSIGYETAKQLLQKGYYVFLGSRSKVKGEDAVKKLQEVGLTNVETIQIDVTNDASVVSARAAVGKKTEVLDVLINNAGISGGLPQTALATNVQVFRDVYETNVFGVVRVTQAFIDLLQKSDEPRIVNVSSGLGSITMNNDPTYKYYPAKVAAYNSSKAALNMITVILAYELRHTALKVNSVDPGYTATDFNNHSGPGTVETAAASVVRATVLSGDGPTGAFFSEDNEETGFFPW